MTEIISPTSSPASGGRATSLGYHNALDGLRGLSLLAIIVYHSGIGGAPGAFLSVSTFFTLSGFLITALMLAEQERNGGISLRGFWSRRLRRLLPAALTAITLIAVASVWLADSSQWSRLRGDALAAIAYVANWRFIAVGDSYGAAFGNPSPYTHFWTLAIEEQFYVLLPLVVVGLLAASRGSRRVLTVGLVGLVAASVLWANWLVHRGASVDRLYFGTDVRVVELLAGGLLAVWWMRRPDPLRGRAAGVVRVLSPLAVVAMIGLWLVADLRNIAVYRGGLGLYTILTILAILGCLQPGGLTHRVLSFKPLVWIGVVSYGAYLVHFPVLLWLEQHTALSDVARIGLGVVITFTIAWASARFLEGPIRTGALRPALAGVSAVGAIALSVVAVLGLTAVVEREEPADLDAVAAWLRYVEQTEAQDRSDAPRIAMFGDSTALMASSGVTEYSRLHPDEFVASNGWSQLGCGLLPQSRRIVRGEETGSPQECAVWLEEWARVSAERPADVAAVLLGPWEVTDQQLEPGGPFMTLGEDPELTEASRAALRRGVDTLLEHNGMVVLIVPPDVEFGRVDGRSPAEPFPESDPARMEAYRQLLTEVAAEYDDRVQLLDMASWVDERPDDARLRPDGVHLTDHTTMEVAPWLGPALARFHTERTGLATTQIPRG